MLLTILIMLYFYKLASMDVPHVIINWIRNFLTQAYHRYTGVLQGTVIGPLLFSVMNDK